MKIAIIEEGAVTRVGDHRELFPQVSFPASGVDIEWLQANSAVEVIESISYDFSTERLEACEPYLDDAGNVYTVKVVPKTEWELEQELNQKISSIRTTRNQLLANSDWTQVLDAPVDKEAWATYRQALRDLTEQSGFPWDVQWPSMPS